MRRIGLLVIGLVALGAAVAVPVLAECPAGTTFTFGAGFGGAGCTDGGLCLVQSPAGLANIRGTFWAKGSFNPGTGGGTTITQGIDNGTCDIVSCVSGGDQTGWLLDPTASGGLRTFLNGDWGFPGTDGCAGTQAADNLPMFVALHDSDASGAYWAVLTSAGKNECVGICSIYNFGSSTNYVLQPLPAARIVGSTRTTSPVGAALNVEGISEAALANAYYPTLESTIITPLPITGAGGVVAGYRVFAQTVLRGAQGPTSRDISAGWSPVTGTVPLGQPATTDAIPCASASGDDAYIAVSLVLDNGFQLPLGPNSVRVACGANLATPGGRPEERPPVGRGRGR